MSKETSKQVTKKLPDIEMEVNSLEAFVTIVRAVDNLGMPGPARRKLDTFLKERGFQGLYPEKDEG